MTTVHFKKWTYEVPTEWNEIGQKQLLEIIKVMYAENEGNRGAILLFRALAGIPWWQFFMMREATLFDVAYECIDFLFDNKLTKNIIPFYKGYAGPSDHLSNLKIGEFTFTEFAYMQYQASKDERLLNTLVATLYRPQKSRFKYNYKLNPEGDFRSAFNPNTISYHESIIAKWPIEVRRAILQFYQGARSEKIQTNPKVFDGVDTGEQSLYGLWSVMRNVAKAGHFGDFDKVQEQYVDTVLMELNETVVEAEKLEAERNKITFQPS